MRLPILITNYLQWRHSHIISAFAAGVGLELFMNFFHIGEANIYRSIKKNLSTSEADSQFKAEKELFEKVVGDSND